MTIVKNDKPNQSSSSKKARKEHKMENIFLGKCKAVVIMLLVTLIVGGTLKMIETMLEN